jgi:hypothetical protein
MENLAWLISGGFAKGYRTQVLGVTTALSAVALWAVGDMSLANLLGNLPIALGGLASLPWAPRWMTPKRPGEPSLQRQNNASRPRAFMPHSGALP